MATSELLASDTRAPRTIADRTGGGLAELDAMVGIQSQVTFNNGGGGATINIGAVDAAASKVEVVWGGTLVYSSLTPNQPGQSAISALATAGTNYQLKVKLWFPGWTRPDVYSGAFLAVSGTIADLVLGYTVVGGP